MPEEEKKGMTHPKNQGKPLSGVSNSRARLPQVSLSPKRDVGCVAVCPSSTEAQEGTHSHSRRLGAAVCQIAQPRGSLTVPQDLRSSVRDPADGFDGNWL